KIKYQSLGDRLGQAKNALAAMPKLVSADVRDYWTGTANTILDELNFDTLPRLETFVDYAQQHLRDVEQKTKPSQSAQELLAMAVSSWLLGTASAEPDANNARLLWSARTMVLDYPKNINATHRKKLLSSLSQSGSVSVDVLARIIKNAPPPFPLDKS